MWVADQGKGVVTMYAISMDGTWITNSPLTVTIPTVGSSTPTGPTGVVQDPTNEFLDSTAAFPLPTSLTRSRAPSRAIRALLPTNNVGPDRGHR